MNASDLLELYCRLREAEEKVNNDLASGLDCKLRDGEHPEREKNRTVCLNDSGLEASRALKSMDYIKKRNSGRS